jgi:hypothetical protein
MKGGIMKAPKIIIVLISLVALFMLLGINPSLAMTRPVEEPIIIHQSPVGETTSSYVARQAKGEVLMYITYIAGYDGPYFSDPTIHNETTAYFTIRYTAGGTSGKLLRVGNLGSREGVVAGGCTTAYFNPTPHGDYSQPDTFSDGIKIGVFEYRPGGQPLTYWKPGAASYDFGINYIIQERTFAGSFTIGGKTYTYGRVGDRASSFQMMSPDPTDPTIIHYIGRSLASGPPL